MGSMALPRFYGKLLKSAGRYLPQFALTILLATFIVYCCIYYFAPLTIDNWHKMTDEEKLISLENDLEKIGSIHGMADASLLLAKYYLKNGEMDKARQKFEDALHTHSKTRLLAYARTLKLMAENLPDLDNRDGMLDEAERLMREMGIDVHSGNVQG